MNRKQLLVEFLPRILWAIEGLCLYFGVKYYNFNFGVNTPLNIIAWILIVMGALIIIWIILHVGKRMVAKNLITGGPYRLVRHPMYLAMYLILIGVGLLLSSYTWFIILIVFIPLWHIVGKAEEWQMASLYGEKYLAYKKKTRMFF
jgi:protein-S-isoprenylcysteine O-methyltransferase Ste14